MNEQQAADKWVDGAGQAIPEDEAGFEQFFLRHRSACRAFIWERCRSLRDRLQMSTGEYDDAVDDAVREAFFVARRQRDRFDPERSRPTTWINTIAERALRRLLRKHMAMAWREVPLVEGDRPSADPCEAVVTQLSVERVLRRMPVRQAQAMQLHYLERRSVLEVSAIMHVPETVVHSLLQRGRSGFGKLWQGEHVHG